MEYSSLFVTLMGIGTVFFGLICIIFLTMAMGAILKGQRESTGRRCRRSCCRPRAGSQAAGHAA